MKRAAKYLLSIGATLIALFLCACVSFEPQPDSGREFALGPVTIPASVSDESASEAFFVERIFLPAYLDTPVIQYRSLDGQILSIGQDRWAEPLDQGIARALFEYIVQSSDSGTGAYYPWPRPKADIDIVSVQFYEFVANEEGSVRLSGTWRKAKKGRSVQDEVFSFSDLSWEVGDTGSLVAAFNEGLARLASEIGKAP